MKQFMNSGKLACTLFLSLFTFSALFGINPQELRELKDFTKISFNISGDLYIEQSAEFLVKIEGNENDLAQIITKLEGNTLIIKSKNFSHFRDKVKIFVSLPELTAVDLAGSGNVIAKNKISTDNINLSVSGSGDILFENLQSTSAKLNLAGSGDMDITGNAKTNLAISIAGSGSIKASNFETQNVDVDISGSGSAKVYALGKLNTNIVGSGSVRYKGQPLINANTVGSGSTKPLQN
jgi:hypothetical protein